MLNKTANLLSIISITNNLKVLYVDDNQASCDQADKLLKNYFSSIDIAIDGINGIECYKNHFLETNTYYDLIITDIEMPNMDGINMAKEIYKINKDQKIIVVSGYNDKKYLIDLINIGVDGFIQKPLSFEQVSDALKQFCKSFNEISLIKLAKNCSYHKLTKEFLHNNIKIDITINESKFIEFLILNHNNSFAIEDIFNYIYYDKYQKEFSSDSIKGLVKRLRKKLPDELIIHNRVTGYKINL
jgi:DNA-binding response OmpR family regulator